MAKPEFIIVKTGQAVAEARTDGRDFEDWFIAGLGPDRFEYRIVRVDRHEELPQIESAKSPAAVLITGSPAMVSHRLDWSERTAAWLADAHAAGWPMLGVCYGHQLLAHALGGQVGPNPAGRNMGRVRVQFSDDQDQLTGSFLPAAEFNVSHVETVLQPPRGARVIASADHDAFHALHFGGRSWGVQFHPEFDRAIMQAYIEARADVLREEGQNPKALHHGLGDNADGERLLRRFARIAAI